MQLLAKVKEIIYDINDSIHTIQAQRIGQPKNQSKTRSIIEIIIHENQKYVVKQAYKFKSSKQFHTNFINEDICHAWKMAR